MFEYFKGLSEGSSYAVVNTEGRICVMASENTVKEESMLRHYAFLLDYMSVPVDKILFITLDDSTVDTLTKRFHHLYPELPFVLTKVNNISHINNYDYVLVRDAHNVDIFNKRFFNALCIQAKNLYVFINANTIRKHHNIDLAEFLEKAEFDFEIDTDGQYSVGQYLQDVSEWLERRRRERELEEQRRKEAAEREAARKAKEEAERKAREEAERRAREELKRKAEEERKRKEAERKAAEEMARKDAERKAREEAERKAHEEAMRKAREEAERIAREKAAEEARLKAIEEEKRRILSHPYYQKLRPYIAWYKNNWQFMTEHGAYRWKAVDCFQKHFDLDAPDLGDNLNVSFSECGELMTGVLLRSQKLLVKCATLCPENTRLLLRNFLNEKDGFGLRMLLYRNMTKRIADQMHLRSRITDEELSHLNNIRAASTYLALAHPSLHYIYRLFPFQQFCTRVGIKAPSVTEFEDEYEKFEDICDKVRELLVYDKDLISMHNSSYTSDTSDYHILTYDFIYAIGYHLVDLTKLPKV